MLKLGSFVVLVVFAVQVQIRKATVQKGKSKKTTGDNLNRSRKVSTKGEGTKTNYSAGLQGAGLSSKDEKLIDCRCFLKLATVNSFVSKKKSHSNLSKRKR